jgi:hypothetical protein
LIVSVVANAIPADICADRYCRERQVAFAAAAAPAQNVWLVAALASLVGDMSRRSPSDVRVHAENAGV